MNDQPTSIEQKLVFAIAPQGQGDGVPILMVGVPRAAWLYMKDGKTHHFDLSKIGVPIKFMFFGCKDHADGMKMLEEAIASRGQAYLNKLNEDFSIQPKDGGASS